MSALRGVPLAVAVAVAVAIAACTPRPAPPPARYVVGGGYQAGGTWFYPHEQFDYVATGLASVLPRRTGLTANGEQADPTALTAAHQTLQLPAVARVTNLGTGLQLVLRVNDRGPASPSRLIALSSRAAALLGVAPDGVAPVRVEVLEGPSLALRDTLAGAPRLAMSGAPRGAVTAEALPPPPGVRQSPRGRVAGPTQAGTVATAAAPAPVPERLPEQVERVAAVPGSLVIEAATFGQAHYAREAAARLARLGARVEPERVGRSERFHVRLGPFETVAAADAALDQALHTGLTDARIVVE